MNAKKQNTIRKIEQKNKEAFYLIVRGLEVGVVSGLITVLYRWLLTVAEEKLMSVIDFVSGNGVRIAIWLIILGVLGLFVGAINKWEPMASGSGIPQTTGEVKGKFNPSWWRVIVAKLIGGTTAVFSGLSLGREGPSVQLGGMAAKGVARLTKADKTTELRMISCGAGAGMASAFNAPLAGTMFVLEEIHHTFDKSVLCMSIVASVTADFTSKLFYGQATTFSYDTHNLPLKHYWLLVLLGAILGIAGIGYNIIMLQAQKIYKKINKIPSYIKLAVVFAISGVVGLIMPQIVCGGHSMVELLLNDRPTIAFMCILLVAKFLFGTISFASGAPGGTLYPLCILGTYIGAIFGAIAINTMGLNENMWQEFVVVGMAGLFASIVRAPITGIILVFELTGSMQNLLPLAVVALTSYAMANLVGITPFYEALLKNLDTSSDDEEYTKRSEKVIKSYVVPLGSNLDGKMIKEIEWGRHVLIVTVERGEESITPSGDVVLHSGDEIVMLVSQRRLARDEERLESLFEARVDI